MTPLRILIIFFLSLAPASAMLLTGVSTSPTGGGSITPSTCTGTIDLSKGCALPMLGGNP